MPFAAGRAESAFFMYSARSDALQCSGTVAANRAGDRAVTRAAAASGVTPGFSRPITLRNQLLRASRLGRRQRGTYTCTDRPTSTPKNPSSTTPTTVWGLPLNEIGFPTIDGEPPYAVCR